MGKDYILDLIRSKKTIFTFKDLILLWGESNVNFVKKKIHRYVKAGKMNSVRKGIYSKDKNYDKYELATKIYTPAYISLETALGAAGVTFQLYGQIFIVSYKTKEIECDGQTYSYKKIKDTILTNQAGIESRENYNIASPERAFLDVVYLHKDYHFDNLSALNWGKVFEILPIYNNKSMEKRVTKYYTKHEDGELVERHLLNTIKADMFAHKLVAMYKRIGKVNRDIFDVWFFLQHDWPINKEIVEKRTAMPFKNFLQKCIDALEKLPDRGILAGMGDLLNEKQKTWAKVNLRKDTIFLLKLKLENER